MHRSRKALKYKSLSERGKKMATARWKLDRERRDAEMPERLVLLKEIEIQNLPCKEGDFLGTLPWADHSTGRVRRWHIKMGNRSDRITYTNAKGNDSKSCGWTQFLAKLRGHLSSHT